MGRKFHDNNKKRIETEEKDEYSEDFVLIQKGVKNHTT